MAAPPRVAPWLRSAPDGEARVLHACADAVHLDVAGRGVSLVGPGGPGLPLALRSNLAVVSSSRAATPYVEGGILHWGGRVLVTGRLVDVRAPRFDAARVPKASPAVAMGTPRSRAAGLVAFAPRVDAASVASLVGTRRGPHPARRRRAVRLARRRTAPPASRHPSVDDAVRRLLPRTTTLSASLLDCALAGEVADPVAGLPPLPRYDGRGRRAGAGWSVRPQLRAAAWPTASTSPSTPSPPSGPHEHRPRRAAHRRLRRLGDAAPGEPAGAAAARRGDGPGRDGDAAEPRGPGADRLRDPRRRHGQPPRRRGPARRHPRRRPGPRRRTRRGRPCPDRQPPRRRRAVRGSATSHDGLGPASARRVRRSSCRCPE